MSLCCGVSLCLGRKPCILGLVAWGDEVSVCHGEDMCPMKTICICGVLSIGHKGSLCVVWHLALWDVPCSAGRIFWLWGKSVCRGKFSVLWAQCVLWDESAWGGQCLGTVGQVHVLWGWFVYCAASPYVMGKSLCLSVWVFKLCHELCSWESSSSGVSLCFVSRCYFCGTSAAGWGCVPWGGYVCCGMKSGEGPCDVRGVCALWRILAMGLITAASGEDVLWGESLWCGKYLMYCGEYLCAVRKSLCWRKSMRHRQSPCPATRVRVLWGVFVCCKDCLCPVEWAFLPWEYARSWENLSSTGWVWVL